MNSNEAKLFKIFLLAMLYSKPMNAKLVKSAYLGIIKSKIVSLNKLANTKWSDLVDILDHAKYVRFDFSTASRLIYVSDYILKHYGSISNLINSSKNDFELRDRLMEIKGIGPKTAKNFITLAKA